MKSSMFQFLFINSKNVRSYNFCLEFHKMFLFSNISSRIQKMFVVSKFVQMFKKMFLLPKIVQKFINYLNIFKIYTLKEVHFFMKRNYHCSS